MLRGMDMVPDKQKLVYAENKEVILNMGEMVFAARREVISDKQTLVYAERKIDTYQTQTELCK
jgi:hypothetical protein